MRKSTKSKTSAVETPAASEKTKVAASTPVISPRVAAAAAAAVAPAPEVKKPVVPQAPKPAAPQAVTKIRAQIDIGFGNELFIRGNAAGLSWDKGIQMNCVNNDLWTFTLVGMSAPVAFKFLVNDLTWSAGEDYVAQPGDDFEIAPTF